MALNANGMKHWLMPIAEPITPQAVPRIYSGTKNEIAVVMQE